MFNVRVCALRHIRRFLTSSATLQEVWLSVPHMLSHLPTCSILSEQTPSSSGLAWPALSTHKLLAGARDQTHSVPRLPQWLNSCIQAMFMLARRKGFTIYTLFPSFPLYLLRSATLRSHIFHVAHVMDCAQATSKAHTQLDDQELLEKASRKCKPSDMLPHIATMPCIRMGCWTTAELCVILNYAE